MSISERASLQEAARLMASQSLTELSVVNFNGAQVGSLSETDILRCMVGQAHLQAYTPTLTAFGGTETRVRGWMRTTPLVSLGTDSVLADAPLVEAMGLMLERNMDELAVVDAAHQVLGVIARRDVLRAIGHA